MFINYEAFAYAVILQLSMFGKTKIGSDNYVIITNKLKDGPKSHVEQSEDQHQAINKENTHFKEPKYP